MVRQFHTCFFNVFCTFFVAKMIHSQFFVAHTISAGFLLQKLFEHTCFVAKTIYTHFFLSQKLFMHFFVTKRIYAYFLCRENNLHAFFVAKKIYALRPESFCALKVATRKVQTFWASEIEWPRNDSHAKGCYWNEQQKHVRNGRWCHLVESALELTRNLKQRMGDTPHFV